MKRPSLLLLVAVAAVAGACGSNEQRMPGRESAATLLGTVWQWQAFQDSADGAESNDLVVPVPAEFTLRLNGGSSAIRADCNSVRWPYVLDASSLRFNSTGPTTMAYCGDDSLDRRYLELLASTATYVLAGNMLYLNLGFDAGNMVFVAAD